jgi:hypothetical protein
MLLQVSDHEWAAQVHAANAERLMLSGRPSPLISKSSSDLWMPVLADPETSSPAAVRGSGESKLLDDSLMVDLHKYYVLQFDGFGTVWKHFLKAYRDNPRVSEEEKRSVFADLDDLSLRNNQQYMKMIHMSRVYKYPAALPGGITGLALDRYAMFHREVCVKDASFSPQTPAYTNKGTWFLVRPSAAGEHMSFGHIQSIFTHKGPDGETWTMVQAKWHLASQQLFHDILRFPTFSKDPSSTPLWSSVASCAHYVAPVNICVVPAPHPAQGKMVALHRDHRFTCAVQQLAAAFSTANICESMSEELGKFAKHEPSNVNES